MKGLQRTSQLLSDSLGAGEKVLIPGPSLMFTELQPQFLASGASDLVFPVPLLPFPSCLISRSPS